LLIFLTSELSRAARALRKELSGGVLTCAHANENFSNKTAKLKW